MELDNDEWDSIASAWNTYDREETPGLDFALETLSEAVGPEHEAWVQARIMQSKDEVDRLMDALEAGMPDSGGETRKMIVELERRIRGWKKMERFVHGAVADDVEEEGAYDVAYYLVMQEVKAYKYEGVYYDPVYLAEDAVDEAGMQLEALWGTELTAELRYKLEEDIAPKFEAKIEKQMAEWEEQ